MNLDASSHPLGGGGSRSLLRTVSHMSAPSCKNTLPHHSKRSSHTSIAGAVGPMPTQYRRGEVGTAKFGVSVEETEEIPDMTIGIENPFEAEDAELLKINVVVRNMFHRIACRFADSKAFNGLILIVILLNTGILIATTWQSVSVKCGGNTCLYITSFEEGSTYKFQGVIQISTISVIKVNKINYR